MTTDGSGAAAPRCGASDVTRVLLARHALLGRGSADDPWRCVPARLEIAAGRLRSVTPITEADATAHAAPGDVLAGGGLVERSTAVADTSLAHASRAAPAAEVLEGLLTPALVNHHVHLPLIGLRGVSHAWAGSGAAGMVEQAFFAFERRLDGPAAKALAQLGAYDALLNGTGCVWEHYYFAEWIAEALAEVGIAAVIAPTLQDLAGPGANRTAENLAVTARIATSSAWAAAGITAAVGLHATDTCSKSLLRQAIALASVHGLPVHMHLAQSSAEVCAVNRREGLSPTDWLTSLLREARGGSGGMSPLQVLAAHALYAPIAELRALAEAADLTLAACPSSQSIFAFPAPVEAWSAAGLPWRIGTDCAASNDGHNLLAEARLLPALARARRMAQVLARLDHPHGEMADGAAAGVPRGKAGVRSPYAHVPDMNADAVFRRAVAGDAADLSADHLLSAVMGGASNLHPALPCGALEPGALANLALWSWDHPSFFPEQPQPAAALVFGQPLLALRRLIVRGNDIGEASPHWREALLDSTAYQRALSAARRALEGL